MSSEAGLVRLEVLDGAARVTLTRSAKRNAISSAVADEFSTAVQRSVAEGARVVVLQAEGPVFCAGADLSNLEASADAVDRTVAVIGASPVLWMASVHSPVLGAGLSLLGACPLVLASEAATFALPELARGFFPTGMIDAQAAVLGARAAFDLAFRAEPIDAGRALQMGLVSEVFPGDGLDSAVQAVVDRLLGMNAAELLVGVRLWQQRAGAPVSAD